MTEEMKEICEEIEREEKNRIYPDTWYADQVNKAENMKNVFRLQIVRCECIRRLAYNSDNLNKQTKRLIDEAEKIVPSINLTILHFITGFKFHETPQSRIDLVTKRKIAIDHIDMVTKLIVHIWRQEGVI